MVWVVAPPGDQVLPEGALEVRPTLPPEQNVVGPLGEMMGAEGVGVTVTVTGAEDAEVQPLPSVTCTV
jgi:hypothetical protein